jgi:hypothetical protein
MVPLCKDEELLNKYGVFLKIKMPKLHPVKESSISNTTQMYVSKI